MSRKIINVVVSGSNKSIISGGEIMIFFLNGYFDDRNGSKIPIIGSMIPNEYKFSILSF